MSMDVVGRYPTRSTRNGTQWRWSGFLLVASGFVVVLATARNSSAAELAPYPTEPPQGVIGAVMSVARDAFERFEIWYRKTPPLERVAWGGLAACALLAMSVTLERLIRVRRSLIIPEAFVDRFQHRLSEGLLERGKALDYCELNPSPASRVALAAIRRWGRSTTDLERGVSLARRVEHDQLLRNLGTLRRVAAMAPLLGLLGSLTAVGRILATLTPGDNWGPALAGAIGPLTGGVALAILVLLVFDGLTVRAERLASDLERIGAETIDAVALSAPPVTATSPPVLTPTMKPPIPAAHVASARPPVPHVTAPRPPAGHGPSGPAARTPHALRVSSPRRPGRR